MSCAFSGWAAGTGDYSCCWRVLNPTNNQFILYAISKSIQGWNMIRPWLAKATYKREGFLARSFQWHFHKAPFKWHLPSDDYSLSMSIWCILGWTCSHVFTMISLTTAYPPPCWQGIHGVSNKQWNDTIWWRVSLRVMKHVNWNHQLFELGDQRCNDWKAINNYSESLSPPTEYFEMLLCLVIWWGMLNQQMEWHHLVEGFSEGERCQLRVVSIGDTWTLTFTVSGCRDVAIPR